MAERETSFAVLTKIGFEVALLDERTTGHYVHIHLYFPDYGQPHKKLIRMLLIHDAFAPQISPTPSETALIRQTFLTVSSACYLTFLTVSSACYLTFPTILLALTFKYVKFRLQASIIKGDVSRFIWPFRRLIFTPVARR